MNGAAMFGLLIPWTVAMFGFFGLVLKLRVSGDPALWKRITELEKKLDDQAKEFNRRLTEERQECSRKLAELGDEIDQLRQQAAGYPERRPLSGALNRAFPVLREVGADDGLTAKLDKQPGRKR